MLLLRFTTNIHTWKASLLTC